MQMLNEEALSSMMLLLLLLPNAPECATQWPKRTSFRSWAFCRRHPPQNFVWCPRPSWGFKSSSLARPLCERIAPLL